MVAALWSGVCSMLPPVENSCSVVGPANCGCSRRRRRWRSGIAFPAFSKGAELDAAVPSTGEVDNDLNHVIKFSMTDFEINDQVSVGLTSRADEFIIEATVNYIDSPLYNTKVVLRRLVSFQAKRRGRRAIEVLKRLVQRRLMYHSYSMQVYGYVCPSTTDDDDLFILVHGVGFGIC